MNILDKIKIIPKSSYLDEKSDISNHLYFFVYNIQILNESDKTYQLLSSEMKSNIFESFFIIDAGFLTLLSKHPFKYEKWILTPHHGEAAQLLDKSSSWIENNRLEASCLIQKKYSGIVILKGRDTIINTGKKIFICKHGGPYMGVAGMGDCLTGVLNSFEIWILSSVKLAIPITPVILMFFKALKSSLFSKFSASFEDIPDLVLSHAILICSKH